MEKIRKYLENDVLQKKKHLSKYKGDLHFCLHILDVFQYFLQNIKILGTIKCEAFYVPTSLSNLK